MADDLKYKMALLHRTISSLETRLSQKLSTATSSSGTGTNNSLPLMLYVLCRVLMLNVLCKVTTPNMLEIVLCTALCNQ